MPALWFFTDRSRVFEPLEVIERLPRNTAIVIRDYDMSDRAQLAAAITKAARRRGFKCLIAADIGLGLRLGADGVHWPAWAVRHRRIARATLPRHWVETASVHNRLELHAAQKAGVDAVFVSPIFPTQSHPGAASLGCLRAIQLVSRVEVPVFALGGLTPEAARRLPRTAFAGLGAIQALAV